LVKLPRPRTQALTLDVIMRAVFGSRDERLRRTLARILDVMGNPLPMMAMLLAGPKLTEAALASRRAPLDAVLFDLIARRRAAGDLGERDDILSMLIASTDMDDRTLRDELLTLLAAGHETTATALAWALERLARHPTAWERLRGGDEDYLDAVVKETLRLRPVVPAVLRMLKAPASIAGYDLPAGVAVLPNILLVHTREDVYPDPFAFRPERFLDRPAGTYTWIPFGGGVRRCLGASFAIFEMKAVLRAVAAVVERLEPSETARLRCGAG
jgi:cytochrome P450